MFVRPALRRRLKLVLLSGILTSSTSACDGLLRSDQAAFARQARVIITNEGASPLLLVTSTQFVARTNPLTGEQEVAVSRADTVPVAAASFDRTFEIFGADRFLAALVNPDTARTATVHLRVQLDNREVYSQRATLRDASLQYFNYFQR